MATLFRVCYHLHIMNNTTINNFLKYAIITGLALISFIPLYVANGLFFPFISGKGFALRIIIEIVFALWLVLVLREKGTNAVGTSKSVLPRVNVLTISVTAFAFIALVADLFGFSPLRSIWSNFERMEGWMIIVHLWAYFMVLSSVLTTKENWHRFFNVVLIGSTITAFYGLFQFFGWAATHQGSRVDASLGNSEYMAVYMIISAFLSEYLAITYFNKKPEFWIYSVGAAFFSFIMFQTATRGTILAWLAAIILSAFIYAVWGREKKGQSNLTRGIAGGVLALVVLVIVLFYYNREAKWIQNNAVLGRLATISLSDTKTQARRFIWPMAVKGVFETPKTTILGVGQENFNYIFNSHYDPKMWMHEQWFDRAHNVFLDWLVAGGVLGLLAYLALYVISLIYIFRSNLSIGQKSVLIGLIAAYAMHNIFVFDNQTSYFMFFTFLAFIHSLSEVKTPALFKHYSKNPSEDAVTVRDYIFVPAIVIALGFSLYFVNVRPIQANTRLISALIACSNANSVSAPAFQKALDLNQTVANQEIREQLLTCGVNVIQNQTLADQKKVDFYNLAKKEVDNQIKSTPNDARIYIIAASFYGAVGDYKNATSLAEKANVISPNKQTIVSELVSNYLNIGKMKEAEALAETSYLSATDNLNAKKNYMAALIVSGDSAKIEKLFAAEPKAFNDSKIINAYLFTKQYDKAIAIYKDMIKDTPSSQDLYPALAYAYVLNKQNSVAIETLKDAGEKFPLLKTQTDAFIKQIQGGKI